MTKEYITRIDVFDDFGSIIETYHENWSSDKVPNEVMLKLYDSFINEGIYGDDISPSDCLITIYECKEILRKELK